MSPGNSASPPGNAAVSPSRASQQQAERKAIGAERPAYAALHSPRLQDVLARRDKTAQAFFRRGQRGEKAGFPRCKGRDRSHRCTCKEDGNGARLDTGALVLAKIGRSSVHWSRPSEGTPKTVTITRAADGWSVCLSCADVPCQPLPLSGQATGIELGLESLAPLADGSEIATPRILRVAALNLKRAQRRVARRKKGSQRRRKAVVRRAKAHQHTRNQRRDFPHQAACKLLRAYDVIYHDELRVGTRVPNHSRAKSLADAGWSAFLAIRTFKAASAGKRVHAVTPAYPS